MIPSPRFRSLPLSFLPKLVFLLGVVTTSLPAAPFIVAHRGASAEAPENTLPAFVLAWKQGADAIEGDFRLTADGRIVCFHDADTNKITGLKRVVATRTLAELQELDVGVKKAEAFRGTRIPTLEGVLATVPAGKKIYIEIKTGPEIIPALIKILDASGLDADQLVIIAFDADVIEAMKKQRPKITANWLYSFKQGANCAEALPGILTTLRRIKADGLGTNPHETLDRTFVQGLDAESFHYHVWTVDDPGLARRLLAIGTRSITTNTPGKLREALRE